MSTADHDQLMLSIKTPETAAEAYEAMNLLNAYFDGGFHPDDPIDTIQDYTGEPYFGEEASKHYTRIIEIAFDLLDDIYQVVLDLTGYSDEDED